MPVAFDLLLNRLEGGFFELARSIIIEIHSASSSSPNRFRPRMVPLLFRVFSLKGRRWIVEFN